LTVPDGQGQGNHLTKPVKDPAGHHINDRELSRTGGLKCNDCTDPSELTTSVSDYGDIFRFEQTIYEKLQILFAIQFAFFLGSRIQYTCGKLLNPIEALATNRKLAIAAKLERLALRRSVFRDGMSDASIVRRIGNA
jgi:hypothetical protein